MPTVLRVGPYRFFFFAGAKDEPPHVHVERDDKEAKFWLAPPRLERNGGFSRKGVGIHWPELDEDISVGNLLRGQPSGESQRSLKAWLASRGGGRKKKAGK